MKLSKIIRLDFKNPKLFPSVDCIMMGKNRIKPKNRIIKNESVFYLCFCTMMLIVVFKQ
jgi:hypothetical protein